MSQNKSAYKVRAYSDNKRSLTAIKKLKRAMKIRIIRLFNLILTPKIIEQNFIVIHKN